MSEDNYTTPTKQRTKPASTDAPATKKTEVRKNGNGISQPKSIFKNYTENNTNTCNSTKPLINLGTINQNYQTF